MLRRFLAVGVVLALGCDGSVGGAMGPSDSAPPDGSVVTDAAGPDTQPPDGSVTADTGPADASPPSGSHLTSAHCPTAPAHPPMTSIVVGGGGTEGRVGVTLDGETWVDDTTVSLGNMSPGHTRNLIRGTGYGGGVFVAVGGNDNSYISTSCDGVNWRFDVLGTNVVADPVAPYDSFLSDVAYLNGTFVAAGGAGTLLTSTDHGLTWTSTGEYQGGHYRGIAVGNGMFIATGHTWGSVEMSMTTTSTDGVNWTPAVNSPGELGGVVFGNGVFVSTGGGRCVVTSDGITFNDCGVPLTDGLTGAQFINGQFHIQTFGGHWFSSADGRNWTGPTDGWLPDSIVESTGRMVMSRWMARGYGTQLDQWTEFSMPSLGNLVIGPVLWAGE